MSKKHHIVIVGGGAGGLELATQLGDSLGKKGLAEITLVDGTLTHFWKPLLHEVAAGTINSHIDELSYAAHARAHYFDFRLGYMDELNRANKTISLAATIGKNGETVIPRRSFGYDSLVIAVGSQTNDFGTKGVAKHCLFLDSQKQAQHFQRTFLERWMIACTQEEDLREGQLNVAIAGAGATGVELAAELHTAIHEMIEHGFNAGADKPIEFTIIDAADRVLPVLPEEVSASTEKVLADLGVNVLTSEMICEATPEGFHTQSGQFVPAEIKVWAAGIKAPEWLGQLDGLETNRINQLVVKNTLQTSMDEDIFAIGDCASCPQPNSDRPVPPRAQSAHQPASILFKTLKRRIKGQPPVEFIYSDKGSLVNLSRYSTVGALMGNLFSKSTEVKIEGFFARMAYVSLYKMHQYALHGLVWVLLMSMANVLTKGIKPRMKLH
jgi:NADH dehydrogenase